jgi:ElaB/YqjD/DUF883 family membrane-anchored ribosome-binding protein
MTSTDYTQLTRKQVRARIVDTREALSQNLDALEEKFDIPLQIEKTSRKIRARADKMRHESPVKFAAVAAGTILAIGVTGYLVIKIATKKF